MRWLNDFGCYTKFHLWCCSILLQGNVAVSLALLLPESRSGAHEAWPALPSSFRARALRGFSSSLDPHRADPDPHPSPNHRRRLPLYSLARLDCSLV